MKRISKRLITLLIFSGFCNALIAQVPDIKLITSVIETAYVEGTQNRGDLEEIRKGFHPEFRMLRLVDNKLIPFSLDEWIAAIEKQKTNNPEPVLNKTSAKILSIDIIQNAAVVKLELHKEGKRIFTDYLSLYRFDDEGWRIVSKTYFKH